MGIFLQDDLTDISLTNLSAHTVSGAGAAGGAWSVNTQDSTSAVFLIDATTKLYATTQGSYVNAASPINANYSVRTNIHVNSTINQSIGPIARCIATGALGQNFYSARYTNSSHTIELFKFINNVSTSLGSVAVTAWIVGSDHWVQINCTNNTISVDTSETVGIISVTDSSLTVAGKAGIRINAASTLATGFHVTGVTGTDIVIVATAITNVGPTTGFISEPSTSFTLALSPVNGTTSGDVHATLSDGGAGGTFLPSNVLTLNTATQSLAYTYTPATAGAITISVTNDGGLSNPTNLTYTSVDTVTIPVNDASVHWSPGNVYVNGSSYARMLCNHGYCKMGFTGTSYRWLINPAIMAGLSAGSYPYIYWEVDGLPWQNIQLASTTTQVVFATGLAAGNHRIWAWMYIPDSSVDVWRNTAPLCAIDVTSVKLDVGATAITPTDECVVWPDIAIFFGDSITQAVNIHPIAAWPSAVGNALNCEMGAIGYSSQGWQHAGNGTCPAFPSTWQFYFAGQARTLADPKYVFNNECYNGGFVPSDVTSWIVLARAAWPTSKIMMVVAFAQRNASDFKAGVAAYQAAHSDPNVYLIDLVTAQPSDPSVNNWLGIGPHPDNYGSSWIGAQVAQKVQAALGSGGGGGNQGFNPFG